MAMQNIKLILEYDGTRYRGWQSGKKDENHTLSGKISEVLRRMTEEEITLFCGEKTGAVFMLPGRSLVSRQRAGSRLRKYESI